MFRWTIRHYHIRSLFYFEGWNTCNLTNSISMQKRFYCSLVWDFPQKLISVCTFMESRRLIFRIIHQLYGFFNHWISCLICLKFFWDTVWTYICLCVKGFICEFFCFGFMDVWTWTFVWLCWCMCVILTVSTEQVKIYFIFKYSINMNVVTILNDGCHVTVSFDILQGMFLWFWNFFSDCTHQWTHHYGWVNWCHYIGRCHFQGS